MPYRHPEKDAPREQQWNVAALLDLAKVGDKKGGFDDKEKASNAACRQQAPAPDLAHGEKQQNRGHQHRAGHRNAVGASEVARVAEPQRESDGREHEHPVCFPNVDLAGLFGRGMPNLQRRQPAELDCLVGHGENARDYGLARNDGGCRGQNDQRNEQRRGAQVIEDVIG